MKQYQKEHLKRKFHIGKIFLLRALIYKDALLSIVPIGIILHKLHIQFLMTRRSEDFGYRESISNDSSR